MQKSLVLKKHFIIILISLTPFIAPNYSSNAQDINDIISYDPEMTYIDYTPQPNDQIISRTSYKKKLYGFWLGQCIANWTGLVTEMDKVGNIGEFKTGKFYTRDDWGKPDQPSIWSNGVPSSLSPTIDYVFEKEDGIWGADDDTDIEYIYQHLMYFNKTSILNGQQIKDGWLKHIKKEEENYLWVSNQPLLIL